jgi:hypothetical protein
VQGAAGRFPGDVQGVEGTVFTLAVPRATAAALLPSGLELNAANETWPISYTFCTQLEVGSPFTHYTYTEFFIGVPYVQWDDAHAPRYPNYRGPFSYLPHLYLNESTPVDLGHAYVGDRKEFADIRLDESYPAGDGDGNGTFAVTGRADAHWDPDGVNASGRFPGEQILNAQWRTTGPYRDASAFPTLSLAGHELPNVARWPNDGNWSCLPQTWYPGTAKVTPAKGSATISEPFQAGLAPASWDFAALGAEPAGQSVVGGFRIRAEWDYTNLPLHPEKKDCASFNL